MTVAESRDLVAFLERPCYRPRRRCVATYAKPPCCLGGTDPLALGSDDRSTPDIGAIEFAPDDLAELFSEVVVGDGPESHEAADTSGRDVPGRGRRTVGAVREAARNFRPERIRPCGKGRHGLAQEVARLAHRPSPRQAPALALLPGDGFDVSTRQEVDEFTQTRGRPERQGWGKRGPVGRICPPMSADIAISSSGAAMCSSRSRGQPNGSCRSHPVRAEGSQGTSGRCRSEQRHADQHVTNARPRSLVMWLPFGNASRADWCCGVARSAISGEALPTKTAGSTSTFRRGR